MITTEKSIRKKWAFQITIESGKELITISYSKNPSADLWKEVKRLAENSIASIGQPTNGDDSAENNR